MYRNFIFFVPLFLFLGPKVQKDINHILQIIIQNCHWSMKDSLRFYPQPHAQSPPSFPCTDTHFNALDIQLQRCSFILCDFECVYVVSNLHKWDWAIYLLFIPLLCLFVCQPNSMFLRSPHIGVYFKLSVANCCIVFHGVSAAVCYLFISPVKDTSVAFSSPLP